MFLKILQDIKIFHDRIAKFEDEVHKLSNHAGFVAGLLREAIENKQTKPEETKPEETKPEETKPEETKPEEQTGV